MVNSFSYIVLILKQFLKVLKSVEKLFDTRYMQNWLNQLWIVLNSQTSSEINKNYFYIIHSRYQKHWLLGFIFICIFNINSPSIILSQVYETIFHKNSYIKYNSFKNGKNYNIQFTLMSHFIYWCVNKHQWYKHWIILIKGRLFNIPRIFKK